MVKQVLSTAVLHQMWKYLWDETLYYKVVYYHEIKYSVSIGGVANAFHKEQFIWFLL